MMFTVEETSLIAAFDHSTRAAAIVNMLVEAGNVADPELKEQVRRTAEKLRRTSDEDFIRVDFTVYDEEDDDEQVG